MTPKIKKNQSNLMKELLSKKAEEFQPLRPGELIEGKIIEMSKTALILDLGHRGTGIIYGIELKENRNAFKELKLGDKISSLVLDPENDEGYVELSLKEANLEKIWQDLKDKKQTKETIAVKVVGANRGGLVVNFSGISGFLPVSQLAYENYPKIKDGDKEKILEALNKFVNKEMKVKIISLDRYAEQIILSEKALEQEKNREDIKNHKKEDIIKKEISNIS